MMLTVNICTCLDSGEKDQSPIRTGDVCKNKFTWHLSDKTSEFWSQFIYTGESSSMILRTQERAAHVVSHMVVCCI